MTAAFLVQFRVDGSERFETEYASRVGDSHLLIRDVRLQPGALLKLRLPVRSTGELREVTGRVMALESGGSRVAFEDPDEETSAVVRDASSSELPTEDILYREGSTEDLISQTLPAVEVTES
ncbi:MAG TPA: hypothetical protein RMG48_02845 [Myxococcales bacterium LLY-WYZ-16_1]|jgi:hypothetical protein|nr:hypothetical protein [Myxococcales bacterium LLY-WYZ-16_1]